MSKHSQLNSAKSSEQSQAEETFDDLIEMTTQQSNVGMAVASVKEPVPATVFGVDSQSSVCTALERPSIPVTSSSAANSTGQTLQRRQQLFVGDLAQPPIVAGEDWQSRAKRLYAFYSAQDKALHTKYTKEDRRKPKDYGPGAEIVRVRFRINGPRQQSAYWGSSRNDKNRDAQAKQLRKTRVEAMRADRVEALAVAEEYARDPVAYARKWRKEEEKELEKPTSSEDAAGGKQKEEPAVGILIDLTPPVEQRPPSANASVSLVGPAETCALETEFTPKPAAPASDVGLVLEQLESLSLASALPPLSMVDAEAFENCEDESNVTRIKLGGVSQAGSRGGDRSVAAAQNYSQHQHEDQKAITDRIWSVDAATAAPSFAEATTATKPERATKPLLNQNEFVFLDAQPSPVRHNQNKDSHSGIAPANFFGGRPSASVNKLPVAAPGAKQAVLSYSSAAAKNDLNKQQLTEQSGQTEALKTASNASGLTSRGNAAANSNSASAVVTKDLPNTRSGGIGRGVKKK